MRKAVIGVAAAIVISSTAQAALAPGARAPDFTTQGAIGGKTFTLNLKRQLAKGPVVLYFFPAAFTPGCNAEAKLFADNIADFRAEGAVVIGMSADPIEPLKKFSTEHCAGKFAVASAGPDVIKGYDVALTTNGRTITDRTSYVIAPNGRIIHAHSDRSPAGHITSTLAALKKWNADRE